MTTHSNSAPIVLGCLLYSREEAARMLSISTRALAYLISEDRLPTRRIGSRVLIAADTLKKFAAQSDDQPIVPIAKVA